MIIIRLKHWISVSQVSRKGEKMKGKEWYIGTLANIVNRYSYHRIFDALIWNIWSPHQWTQDFKLIGNLNVQQARSREMLSVESTTNKLENERVLVMIYSYQEKSKKTLWKFYCFCKIYRRKPDRETKRYVIVMKAEDREILTVPRHVLLRLGSITFYL